MKSPLLSLAVALLLIGCATPPDPSTASPTVAGPTGSTLAGHGAEGTSAVATVDLVSTVTGRLSVRVRRPADGASDGGSVLFELEGNEHRGSLVLITPIGTTLARATWTPEGAAITTAQGKRTASRLDDLARGLLGQTLPMAALLSWIRAEPWPAAPFTPQAEGFEQLGWSIALTGWHEGVVTARRAASGDAAQEADILVRVRIDTATDRTPRSPAPEGSR